MKDRTIQEEWKKLLKTVRSRKNGRNYERQKDLRRMEKTMKDRMIQKEWKKL